MLSKFDDLKTLMKVAVGKEPGDLLIKNIRILDVYCEKIYPGSLLIKNGKIVSIDPSEKCSAVEEFDGQGLIAVPGFVDPHFHIDSTTATPAALADAIVPYGTTTLCGEILDITHFAGISGKDQVATAKAYVADYDKLPYRLLPLAPGKMSDPKIAEELLAWEGTFGIGEVLAQSILYMDDRYLDIITRLREEGRYVSGHLLHIVWDYEGDQPVGKPTGFRGMYDDEINMFAIAGYPHDHEIFEYSAVNRILKRGMAPLLRTFEDLIEKVVPGIINDHVPTDNICYCMDDLFINDIKNKGHLNLAIQKSINVGLDPIKAVKMATLNTAKNIGLERELGSLTPGRFADIVLLKNMTEIMPVYVFKEGKLVAEQGQLLEPVKVDYSSLKWNFPSRFTDLKAEDLSYNLEQEQLINNGTQAVVSAYNVVERRYEEVTLPVENGKVMPDPVQDVIRVVLIDRTQETKMIKLFAKGFKIKEGAFAVNFNQNVYRVIVAGLDEADMLVAAQEIDKYAGGLVAVNSGGAIVDFLELDVAAIASSSSCAEITNKIDQMEDVIRSWGCDLPNIFMMLWFTGFLYLWD